MPKTKELPSKLSDLILLAVRDFYAVQKKPGYKHNMNSWHAYVTEEKVCYVCLAGCVMANTLRVPKSSNAIPDDLPAPTREKLEAINEVRTGPVSTAWTYITSMPRGQLPADQARAIDDAHALIYKGFNENLGRAPMRVYMRAAAKLAAAGL